MTLSAIDRKFLPIAFFFVTLPILAWAFEQMIHWFIWFLLWGGGVL